MKKIFSIVLVLCMMLSLGVMNASADNDIAIVVDAKVVDCSAYGQLPVIVEGRTLVPLRSVFEALGATVEWNAETRSVTSVKGDVTIILTVDSKEMVVNGIVKTLDVPAQIMNDRTMVPVRAVAEAFGCDVKWDGAAYVVTITSKNEAEAITTDEERITGAKQAVSDALYSLKAGDFEGVRDSYPSDVIMWKYTDYESYLKDNLNMTQGFADMGFNADQEERIADAMVKTTMAICADMEYEIVSAFVVDKTDVMVTYKLTVADTKALDVNKFLTKEVQQAIMLKAMLDLGYTIADYDNLTEEEMLEIERETLAQIMIKVFEVVRDDFSVCDRVTSNVNLRLSYVEGGWKIIEENGVPYNKAN